MRRLALVVVLVVVTAACGTSRPNLVDPGVERQVADTTTTVSAPEPSVLRLVVDGWAGDPADAGPADLDRRVVADLLFEGLTRLDSGGVPRAALAQSWSASEDRLTWVFTMSPEAVDSTGETITARTVMRSLDHVAARGPDDLVATALDAITGWEDRMTGRAGGVAGITAPSADQLVVRLDRPFEPLLEVLAAPAFGIVVDHGVEDPSTGEYRVDPVTQELWPVDETSSLPRIELVDTGGADGAALLRADDADWAVLTAGPTSDDLPGEIRRLPLDVSVGLAVRLDSAESRRAVAHAVDSVALASAIDVTPVPPRIPTLDDGALPLSVTIDVPEGPLSPLGPAVAEQLTEAGVAADVVTSVADEFADRVLHGDALIHPIVLAGGTWSAEDVATTLVPGAVNDLIIGESADRTSLGQSLGETRDLENRSLFADLLVQTAVDEGVLVLIGRLEALVGVSTRASSLRHRADGTLDLTRIEWSGSVSAG